MDDISLDSPQVTVPEEAETEPAPEPVSAETGLAAEEAPAGQVAMAETDGESPLPPETTEPPHWAASLQEGLDASIAEGTRRVLDVFERKLAYDQAKEEQVSRLHAELQQYKGDLLAKTNRPFIMGFIRMHDDLAKVAQGLANEEAEALSPDKVVELFRGFQEDIEIFLDQQGITVFRESGPKFDPRRQTTLRTTSTTDGALAGTVAESLRPGFEQGDSVIQKERVAVYAMAKATAETIQPMSQESPAKEDPQEQPEQGGAHNE